MHEKFRRPFPEERKKSVCMWVKEREIADESKDRYQWREEKDNSQREKSKVS